MKTNARTSRRRKALCALAAVGTVLVSPCVSALNAADVQPLTLLGHWPGRGVISVQDTHVSGNLAYIAAGEAGLLVADVSDPLNPMEVGRCSLVGWPASSLFVSNEYAYVAAGAGGLRIVDISDPRTPTEVGQYRTGGTAISIHVADGIAYVGHALEGVQVLDITNCKEPKHLSTYLNPSRMVKAIQIQGPYGYIAARQHLQVVNFTNRNEPKLIGELGRPGTSIVDLHVAEGRLFVVFGGVEAGLYVIGLSDPSNPEFIDRCLTGPAVGTFPTGIHVSNGYAYVTTEEHDVKIFNVHAADKPQITGRMVLHGRSTPLRVAVSQGRAYVSSQDHGLHIVDVKDPSQPELVGAMEAEWDVRGVGVVGDTIVAADAKNGLHVLNMRDLTRPKRIGFAGVTFDGGRLQIVSDTVVVADGRAGLRFFDLSTPSNPRLAGTYPIEPAAWDARIVDGLAYVACDSAGLTILDVRDPRSPSQLGTYDYNETTGVAVQLAVAGDYVYLADGNAGLHVINVKTPRSPGRVGGIEIGAGSSAQVHGVSVRRNRLQALVSNPPEWIISHDLSDDPAQPRITGNFNVDLSATLYDVHAGIHGAVVAYSGGLVLVDPSSADPYAAMRKTPTESAAKALAIARGRIYVGGGFGLKVFEDPWAPLPLTVSREAGECLVSWTVGAWPSELLWATNVVPSSVYETVGDDVGKTLGEHVVVRHPTTHAVGFYQLQAKESP